MIQICQRCGHHKVTPAYETKCWVCGQEYEFPYTKTIVVNAKWWKKPCQMIDRTTKWGNPFYLDDVNDTEKRNQVIQQYEEYIRSKSDLLEALPELVGKVLGCWCKPKACHGDVLLKLMKERGLINGHLST